MRGARLVDPVTSPLDTRVFTGESGGRDSSGRRHSTKLQPPNRVRSKSYTCAVWLVLVGVMTILACRGPEQLRTHAYIQNQTGQAVNIYHLVGDENQFVVSLDPPFTSTYEQQLFTHSEMFPNGCTYGDLVAEAADGTEIARLSETLCVPQTWKIETDGTSFVR